jgi:hypothetical protein
VNILKFLREQAKNYDCSVCGTNHSKSEISVLGKREGAWVVKVACSKCDTAITLLVYVGEKPTAAAARALAAEPRRSRRPPLSPDDVLDAHEALERYDGDAIRLFAPRDRVKTSTTAS